MMFRRAAFLLFAMSILLAACGGGSPTSSAPTGDAARGEALFNQATIGTSNDLGCKTCHSVVEGETMVGPSLAHIAVDAAETPKEPDYAGKAKTAQEWLRESIVDPNVDLIEGFQPNVMPQDFGTSLTDQQINDLVAYLLTLN